MTIHLDTNQLIGAAQLGSTVHLRVDRWLRGGVILQTSAIAWAEFLCGPVTPAERVTAESILSAIHPIDARSAALGATLFNASGRRARSLANCLIAATALLSEAPLFTENRDDFQPFVPHGLVLL